MRTFYLSKGCHFVNELFPATSVRSPPESVRQGQAGALDLEKNVRISQGTFRTLYLTSFKPLSAIKTNQPSHNINSLLQTFHEPQGSSQQSSSQHQLQTSRLQQGYSLGAGDSPGAIHTPDQTHLSQMSPLDRFGLAGLLATVRSDNPDVASLAIGQDLTQLGLNLNSPEQVHTYQF